MMFQSYALWPHMTVAHNIAYGLRMRGAKSDAIDERVGEMLKLLQLEGYGKRSVTQLSGGQRQRVALGRALAIDPPLLLLDEPMSNLDYKVRLELRHELRALQQRIGITAVYVTHDREEALTLADRIAVIDAGRVAQIGTPEEIFHRRRVAFVAASWAPTTRSTCMRAGNGRQLPRSGVGEPAAAKSRAHFRSDAARSSRAPPRHAIRRAARSPARVAQSRLPRPRLPLPGPCRRRAKSGFDARTLSRRKAPAYGRRTARRRFAAVPAEHVRA